MNLHNKKLKTRIEAFCLSGGDGLLAQESSRNQLATCFSTQPLTCLHQECLPLTQNSVGPTTYGCIQSLGAESATGPTNGNRWPGFRFSLRYYVEMFWNTPALFLILIQNFFRGAVPWNTFPDLAFKVSVKSQCESQSQQFCLTSPLLCLLIQLGLTQSLECSSLFHNEK